MKLIVEDTVTEWKQPSKESVKKLARLLKRYELATGLGNNESIEQGTERLKPKAQVIAEGVVNKITGVEEMYRKMVIVVKYAGDIRVQPDYKSIDHIVNMVERIKRNEGFV